MYLMEWGLWRVETMSDTERKRSNAEASAKIMALEKAAYECGIDNDANFRSVSDTALTRGPVYAFNDTYLEMRGGGTEEKRGVITLLTLFGFVPALLSCGSITYTLINLSITQLPNYSIATILLTAFMLASGIAIIYLYAKFGFRLTRLEMLTSRHLLVRFNRITQQVHLHRPRYCGGIATFAWRSTESTATDPADDSIGSGLRLGLVWHPSRSGLPHTDMMFVGKLGRGSSGNRDEWEFIRRYMEDGPQSLPRPRLSTHLPSPIQAFSAQFEGLAHFAQMNGWPIKVGLLMISPVFFILGTAHWISLLLCWRPRWPKIIREAGQPGKPVPAVTTLEDYPLEVQKRLLANADRYELKTGRRSERKTPSRYRRRSKA